MSHAYIRAEQTKHMCHEISMTERVMTSHSLQYMTCAALHNVQMFWGCAQNFAAMGYTAAEVLISTFALTP